MTVFHMSESRTAIIRERNCVHEYYVFIEFETIGPVL